MLGHERATIVGHSLGGGIAMQFAYQFPQMAERLVLVGSGGLGQGGQPAPPGPHRARHRVRAARWSSRHELHDVARRWSAAARPASVCGPTRSSARCGARGPGSPTSRAQRAFIHTIRAVIDVAGQRVSARDRLYLAHEVPTMIIWGDRDQVIPVSHAHIAHELMPGSRLEIVEGAGHFLPIERPELVDRLLRDFLATTKPAHVSPQRWQEVLKQHA